MVQAQLDIENWVWMGGCLDAWVGGRMGVARVPRSRNMHFPRPAIMHPVSDYLDIVFK